MNIDNREYKYTVGRMFSTSPGEYFLDSWEKMILYNNEFLCDSEYKVHYVKGTVSYHEIGRQQIVDGTKGDWLLLLDTDHQFAPDLFDRLLTYAKRHKSRVLSGCYQYKIPPHAPVVCLWKSPDINNTELYPIYDWKCEPGEVLEVGSVGAGCLLVDTSVFTQIKREFGVNPFEKVSRLSEDYSFCYYCKKLGIPVHWTPHVQSHHVINNVLNINDYKYDGKGLNVSSENGKIIL